MKKNGTPFSTRPLTLVDDAGRRLPHNDATEDAAIDTVAALAEEVEALAAPLVRTSRQALTFVVVSIACATAAIAAGTYAVWLTRRQAAQNALTDVRDLLKSCQERMGQMEDDLQRLPRPGLPSRN